MGEVDAFLPPEGSGELQMPARSLTPCPVLLLAFSPSSALKESTGDCSSPREPCYHFPWKNM